MNWRIRDRRRNRVLMLVENNPYPQDVRVHAEAVTLKDAGYDVTVISPAATGQSWREAVHGVGVYRYPACNAGHGFLGYAWEYAYSTIALFLLSLLVWARKGFDLIHAANPPETLVFIGVFYKLFGKRFVFDHHDLSPEMYCAGFGGTRNDLAYRVLTWFERMSCKVADHIIAANESYKNVEMERDGIAEERITVVRNGPQLGDGFTDPDPALRLGAKTIIVYAGVMASQDGVDHLLRSLKHLAYDLGRTDFACYLVGGGGTLEFLKVLATELSVDKFVTFTGWISDRRQVRRYLASADICVDPDPSNPYNDRSTMVKIAEYMALGKPIIGFDLPENRFTAQEAAIFVRANDELEFAKALAELMDDPARRERMGAFGRRRVETELAWSHSAPRLLSAYRTVLPNATVAAYVESTPVGGRRVGMN